LGADDVGALFSLTAGNGCGQAGHAASFLDATPSLLEVSSESVDAEIETR
jgi:hypothetical protein